MNKPITPPATPRPAHGRRRPRPTQATQSIRPAADFEVGDLRDPRALTRLVRQVADMGLALFDGIDDATALMNGAATVMTIAIHPDAGPDGVTRLTDLGPAGDHPGAAGFSHRALPPHTDRSGISAPAGLVMLSCAAGVFVGGESLLTDAAAVHADLAATNPATLEALHAPRSVLFGGAEGHLGSVFTHVPSQPARCHVRLRLEDLVAFSPHLDEHLPILTAAIERHTIRLTLTPGRGYLLDNHRWLHARTAYTGARTLFRVLGDPRPDVNVHTGIPLGQAHGCRFP